MQLPVEPAPLPTSGRQDPLIFSKHTLQSLTQIQEEQKTKLS